MSTTKTADPTKAAERALATAKETLSERRKALQGNVAKIDSIKAAWSRGDDSIPASEKRAAEDEVARLTPLVHASEQKVKAAERKLKSLTPVLAEVVAWALGDTIHGTKAEAVTGSAPSQPSSDVKVYVHEPRERMTTDTPGQVRGDIRITVTGPAFMAGFDKDAVIAALRAGGLLFDLNVNQIVHKVRDGVFTFDLRVTATPVMPTLPTISPAQVRMLGNVIIQQFAATTRNRAFGEETVAGVANASIVRQSINDDGIRTLDLEVELHVRKTPYGVQSLDQTGEWAKAFLARYFVVNKGLHWLGSIEDVTVTLSDAPFEGVNGRIINGKKATARLKVVSRVA